jgi:hypothetical protein
MYLCALALLAASGAGAAAAAEEAVFDFSISGIPVGTMTIDLRENGGSYTAASRIETSGLVSVVANFWFDGRSAGSVHGDGRVVPVSFASKSKSPRAIRDTRIEWEDGTPVRVSVEPPRSSAPDPAAQSGTLDPVSAGFAVLRDVPPERLCDTTVDVFDGSRRSRLSIASAQRGEDGYVCAGTYARLEGEAHTLSSQREFPFQLLFRDNGRGLAQLERIETRTNFGLAVMQRRG